MTCPVCGRRGDHSPVGPWVLNQSQTADHLRDGWHAPYRWEREWTCPTLARWQRTDTKNTETEVAPA